MQSRADATTVTATVISNEILSTRANVICNAMRYVKMTSNVNVNVVPNVRCDAMRYVTREMRQEVVPPSTTSKNTELSGDLLVCRKGRVPKALDSGHSFMCVNCVRAMLAFALVPMCSIYERLKCI